MADTERVLIGTLGKAHGLRGELTVFCRTDEPERRFAPGASVEVGQGGKPMTVAGSHWHSGTWLVRLAGVEDRTAAEALRGSEVWARVPADEVPADDGEFYDRQLVGLQVRDAHGAVVGTLASVLHNPGQDLLVIDIAGVERLVPFVEALVPVVDLEAGYLQVADVGGLLEDLAEE
jgi:16S rRNA processing protein RimM